MLFPGIAILLGPPGGTLQGGPFKSKPFLPARFTIGKARDDLTAIGSENALELFARYTDLAGCQHFFGGDQVGKVGWQIFNVPRLNHHARTQ